MEQKQLEPTEVFACMDAGQVGEAQALLRRAFASSLPESGDPEQWARAAEAAGMSLLSLRAWQAVLSRDSRHVEALTRLVQLHSERGDHRRAQACRQRLKDCLGTVHDEPLPVPEADQIPDPPPGEPGDGDLVRFVHLFQGREGVHARQWHKSDRNHGYSPVDAPFTVGLAGSHLRGGVTIGIYLVRRDDQVGQLVFDMDATRAAVDRAFGDQEAAGELGRRIHHAGIALLKGLRAAGFDPLLVDSGYKGRHLWCFFPKPEPAGKARALGKAWARVLAPPDPQLAIEVFPKQDSVPPGKLGNLVKIPLGIHRRTGRRCVLLDDQGQPIDDPWERLRQIKRVPLSGVRMPPPSLVTPTPGTASGSIHGQALESAPAIPADDASLLAQAPPPAEHASPFTEADLHTYPRLDAVLSGCSVLGELVRQALHQGRLEHSERVVLEHSLGHLPEGVQAVNYLFRRCHVHESDWMGKPHAGNEISCKGVRKRLSRLVDQVSCDCVFDAGDTYPNPMLHALALPAQPLQGARSLPELLATLRLTESHLAEIQQEIMALRREAAQRLAAQPGGCFQAEDGLWKVEDCEGIPALRFVASA